MIISKIHYRLIRINSFKFHDNFKSKVIDKFLPTAYQHHNSDINKFIKIPASSRTTRVDDAYYPPQSQFTVARLSPHEIRRESVVLYDDQDIHTHRNRYQRSGCTRMRNTRVEWKLYPHREMEHRRDEPHTRLMTVENTTTAEHELHGKSMSTQIH